LQKKEQDVLIREVIDSLPYRQRIAIVLQVYEGLLYKEISKVLGCSTKAVERRLSWAKMNLKEKLKFYLTKRK
jgi:RNA polymerase sigma factor (sigma-70 family)